MSEELEVTATEEAAEEVVETAEATTAEEEVVEVEEADDTSAEPEKKESKGVQKRIDELVKQRGDQERRAERLEKMLEQQLLQQQTTQEAHVEPEPVIQATRQKPTLESCDFDSEKFTDELTDWKMEQREAQNVQRSQVEQQTKQRETAQQTFEQKRVETNTKGREKFTDFEDVVYSLSPEVLNTNLAAAVFETVSPHEVAYYLGKNPDEADRISKLNPIRMALELGRLESKAVIPPKQQQKSSAPPPVTPVGSNATAGAEPDAKKDPQGWLKWERERCSKAGRRY